MSVTMHLYKVRPDVEYTGYYMDYVTHADFVKGDDGYYPLEHKEKELGAPMGADGHWPDSVKEYEIYWKNKEWGEAQENSAWSDNHRHDKIDITLLRACFKDCRGWKRLVKHFDGFPIKTFNNGRTIQKYIPVDRVEYAQGWFFKKRFFNKKMTRVFCTTKKQMENFFKQYIDFNDKHDTRGREAVDRFLNAWEDGMIFECAF